MAGQQQVMTVESLRGLAEKYRMKAADCQEIANFLKKQNSSMFWQSEAASSFKTHMNEYMTVLQRFNDHFTKLNQELHQRAQIVEDTQRSPVR